MEVDCFKNIQSVGMVDSLEIELNLRKLETKQTLLPSPKKKQQQPPNKQRHTHKPKRLEVLLLAYVLSFSED